MQTVPDSPYTRWARTSKRWVRDHVLLRDLSACVWCSTPLTRETVTLDHIVLRSGEGSRWEGNLVAACVACNGKRGDTAWDEWLSECERAGARLRPRLRSHLARRADDPRATRDGLMRSLGMDDEAIAAHWLGKAAIAGRQSARERERRKRARARRGRERAAAREAAEGALAPAVRV